MKNIQNLSKKTKIILCTGGLVLFTGAGIATWVKQHENENNVYTVENEFQNLVDTETNYNQHQAYKTLQSYFTGIDDSKQDKANETSSDTIYQQGVMDEQEARMSADYDKQLQLLVGNRIYEYAKKQAVQDYQTDQDTTAIRLTPNFYFKDELMSMLVSNASVTYMNIYNEEKLAAFQNSFQETTKNNQYDYSDKYSSQYFSWLDHLETDASKEAMNESGFYVTGVMNVRGNMITEETIQKQENELNTNQTFTTVDRKNTESYIEGAKNALQASKIAGDDEEKYVSTLLQLTQESAMRQAEKDITEYGTSGQVELLDAINYQNNQNLSMMVGTTYLSSYETAYQNLQTHTK